MGSTSAPSADDPLANVLGEVGLGEHCLDGVKLVLPHFDVKVLPSSFSMPLISTSVMIWDCACTLS